MAEPEKKHDVTLGKTLTYKMMADRKFNIMVALPCYGDVLHVGCFDSLFKMYFIAHQIGINMTIRTVTTESLITRVRNYFVAEFLGSKEFTHLLFVDSDLSFAPESALRLLLLDKPVVGGIYPIKALQVPKMREILKAEPDISDLKLIQKSLNYTSHPYTGEGTKVVTIINGYVPCDEIATGFMLIKREALEKLRDVLPSLQYKNDVPGYNTPAAKDNFYGFFDTLIHPETKRYLSEDFAFCYRCKKAGIEIWADTTADLTHTGIFHFPDSYRTTLSEVEKLAKEALAKKE
jgi:hypothetical protein